MVELAIADNPHFELSHIELDRGGSSYSVETIEQLAAERPTDRFVFILSADALAGLPGWRRPSRLLELCEVAVVPRLGYTLPTREWLSEHFPGHEERFLFLDTLHLGHSASAIRARAARGQSIRYLVPSAVEDYIRENALYLVERSALGR